jgi:hypothetical protein
MTITWEDVQKVYPHIPMAQLQEEFVGWEQRALTALEGHHQGRAIRLEQPRPALLPDDEAGLLAVRTG